MRRVAVIRSGGIFGKILCRFHPENLTLGESHRQDDFLAELRGEVNYSTTRTDKVFKKVL